MDGPRTFSVLFDPTFRQVRTFSKRPFLISETASEMSGRRLADVDDLFSGVQARPDVLGFIWFDIVKRADWRIERTPDRSRTSSAAPPTPFTASTSGIPDG
ncbi:hypothetical protein ACFQZC_18820 [Streptacidiphilus monticola]